MFTIIEKFAKKRMSVCIQIRYIWVDLFKWNIYAIVGAAKCVRNTQLHDQSNQFGENDNLMRSYSYFFSHKMLKLVCDCVIFHCVVCVFFSLLSFVAAIVAYALFSFILWLIFHPFELISSGCVCVWNLFFHIFALVLCSFVGALRLSRFKW